MKSHNSHRKFSAFTLMELVVVMAIFILILGISILSFSGLRDTMIVNETSRNIQQDIKWVQRGAILLKRESNEQWVYGIGIDLTTFQTDGKYKIFKWCAPEADYGVTVKSTSKYPNYDPTTGQEDANINARFPGGIWGNSCRLADRPLNSSNGWLTEIKGQVLGNVPITNGNPNTSAVYSQVNSDTGFVPLYMLVESVSGRVFFYEGNGNLMNSTLANSNKAGVLSMDVIARRTKKIRRINITSLSGKVYLESLTASMFSPENNYYPSLAKTEFQKSFMISSVSSLLITLV